LGVKPVPVPVEGVGSDVLAVVVAEVASPGVVDRGEGVDDEDDGVEPGVVPFVDGGPDVDEPDGPGRVAGSVRFVVEPPVFDVWGEPRGMVGGGPAGPGFAEPVSAGHVFTSLALVDG
jgi:hypothetical protein